MYLVTQIHQAKSILLMKALTNDLNTQWSQNLFLEVTFALKIVYSEKATKYGTKSSFLV